jgi:hypothetical protein
MFLISECSSLFHAWYSKAFLLNSERILPSCEGILFFALMEKILTARNLPYSSYAARYQAKARIVSINIFIIP